MAQLHIRKKSEEIKHPNQTFVPAALVLTAGIATTLLLQNGQQSPVELLTQARPEFAGAAQSLLRAYLAPQSFSLKGRAWKAVMNPFPIRFEPDEMVTIDRTGPWRVVANRARGVSALGPNSHAYDRPYLDLGKGHYVALRWRDVPSH